MILRQCARVGRRKPQPHEQAVLARAGIVLERRATVIDDVVIQQLHVAGREAHLETYLLRHIQQHLNRLVFGIGQLPDARQQLRALDVREREVAGELAVTDAKDGQVISHVFATRLFAKSAARDGLTKKRMQVGAALQNLVLYRGTAGELADASFRSLTHAKQSHHVATVGVKAQLPR